MHAALHISRLEIILVAFGLMILYGGFVALRGYTELRPRTQLLVAIVCVVLVAVISQQILRLHRGIVVAQSKTPDGTEMCVVQRCNWGAEGWWTTGFYYRLPGKPWGWF